MFDRILDAVKLYTIIWMLGMQSGNKNDSALEVATAGFHKYLIV